jgi:hypothetical protein
VKRQLALRLHHELVVDGVAVASAEAVRSRFEARVARADGDACWLWTGARQRRRNGAPWRAA